MASPDVILFDFDGTLADTAADLNTALNTLLIEEDRAPLPLAQTRYAASHGAAAMLQLGLGVEPSDPGYDDFKQRFLKHYENNMCQQTTLMDGMQEVIDHLEQMRYRWGVVTNKPSYLTGPIMELLGLSSRASCVVCGDTTAHRKPHPEPLIHACNIVQSPARNCLYVGDAERDIAAGKAAGMKTVVALYGYIRNNEQPTRWGADAQIRQPKELIEWLHGTH